jgi:DNA primase
MIPLLCSVVMRGENQMSGVHYAAVQSRVPMARALELLGFVAQRVTGDQLRGPCPVHRSASLRSRSFSVDLSQDVCHCFKCGFAGNQIQLWAALKEMTVYEAAVHLCQEAGVEVPWIGQW